MFAEPGSRNFAAIQMVGRATGVKDKDDIRRMALNLEQQCEDDEPIFPEELFQITENSCFQVAFT